ncbi:MAG: YqaA family protein [Polyangiales bacterium]
MEKLRAEPLPWYRRPLAWVRRLYDWTLSWAYTRYGLLALAVLAFVEASFFPVPPDVLLLALCVSRRERAYLYAAVCTAASVAGGLFGWWLGNGAWRLLGVAAACPEMAGGAFFFEHIPGFTCARFAQVRDLYANNAWMALFGAAFTPIPYKVFTLAAGVAQVPLMTLVSASVVGRGARFFIVAGLLHAFGAPVRRFIEKRFELLALAFTALLIAGFVLLKYAL